jgi:phospholipase C
VAAPASPREAGSLPFPDKPVGEPNEGMPFDHIVVVMMENHSFDNLLGALARTHAGADGLTFDSDGNATNSNPDGATPPTQVRAFPFPNTAQPKNISQSWKAGHQQTNGGAMDGFVTSAGGPEPMGYYTPEVLPFAYSLAGAFTVANRWFCSVAAPTYPNRRFLLAGTAFGATQTEPVAAFFAAPPEHGTIFDQLSDNHVSWGSYFTDVPMTAVIPSIIVKHLDHHHLISKFFHDCEAGSLPAVSFVDPALGKLRSIIRSLPGLVQDALKLLGVNVDALPQAGTEEDPQDMYYGELWAHKVVEAVLRSPAWSRTLLIYTYDEHGGYYDHVPPPPATPPDNIQPELKPGDPAGDYGTYGPRVPAVVVSPYSRPGGSSSVVCDHTSVLATIESKWNLPALTNRDANAATIIDFLDLSSPALLKPPALQAPSDTGPSGPAATSP